MTRPDARGRPGLRAVATLEAVKGLLVLLAGFGAFALIHRDVQSLAEALVRHSHLNPARHVPRAFLEASARLTDARLWMLSAGALAYAGVRFAESWVSGALARGPSGSAPSPGPSTSPSRPPRSSRARRR